MSDRDAFREARDAGLRARHETREARAVRKQVAEEIAAAIQVERGNPERGWNLPGFGALNALMTKEAMEMCESIAREIGSRDPA